jgi:hypothetical protein
VVAKISISDHFSNRTRAIGGFEGSQASTGTLKNMSRGVVSFFLTNWQHLGS